MFPIIALLFLLSGLSALVYELSLVRLLTYSFGHTVYAVTVILTTYMTGLGLGSHYLGRVADRRPQSGLRLYAYLEGGIGLYAVLVLLAWPLTRLLERWLGQSLDPGFGLFLTIKFLVAFLILVPLTFMMGGTLPLVVRYITRHRSEVGRSIGLLYGMNTLGAVLGAFGAGFVLLPALGISSTILCAFGVNVVVCVIAFLLSGRGLAPVHPVPGPEAHTMEPAANSRDEATEELPEDAVSGMSAVVPLVAFGTGLASLGIQVVWTRVFSVLLGPTPYIFTIILVGFLLGLGLGSLITGTWLRGLKYRSGVRATAFSAFASGILILIVYPSLPLLADLMNQVVGPDKAQGMPWWQYDGFRYLVVFTVVFITTLVFGLVLPLLMRLNAPLVRRTGRGVGAVYASNTFGSILGSGLAGFVMLPLVGSNVSSILFASFLLLCALSLLLFLRDWRLLVAGAVIATAAIVPVSRTPLYHFANYLGDRPSVTALDDLAQIVFNKEDPTANVSVMSVRSPGSTAKHVLFVDGILTASDNEDIFWNLALKGHLPLLFHHDPSHVLIVGLGAGITLGAIAQHDMEEITAVEIAKSVISVQDLFSTGNLGAHHRDEVRIVEDDGRDFLVTTPHTYDVITVDQTDPPVMMLYSKDFYEDALHALRPDGIFLQWVPLYKMSDRTLISIIRAFEEVFPHVTIWNGKGCVFLMGTNGRLKVDLDVLAQRAALPQIARSLSRFGADRVDALLSLYLMGNAEIQKLLEEHGSGVPATSDNRPIVEYMVPKERFFPPQQLRFLMSRYPGNVADLLVQPPSRLESEFPRVDFEKVAKALVLLGPVHMARIEAGTLTGDQIGLNDVEFDLVKRYAAGRRML